MPKMFDVFAVSDKGHEDAGQNPVAPASQAVRNAATSIVSVK